MTRAIWHGTVIAESDACKTVEGNKYFPPGAVNRRYLRPSDTHTICAWKGTAHYYDVVVNGEINRDAAWYYPLTTPAATHIRDHVAFWRGVQIEG